MKFAGSVASVIGPAFVLAALAADAAPPKASPRDTETKAAPVPPAAKQKASPRRSADTSPVQVKVSIADVKPVPSEGGATALAKINLTATTEVPPCRLKVVAAGILALVEPLPSQGKDSVVEGFPFGLGKSTQLSLEVPKLNAGDEKTYKLPLKVAGTGRGAVVASFGQGARPLSPDGGAGAPRPHGPLFVTEGHDLLLFEDGKAYTGASTFQNLQLDQTRDKLRMLDFSDDQIEDEILRLKRSGGRGSGEVLPPPSAEGASASASAAAAAERQ